MGENLRSGAWSLVGPGDEYRAEEEDHSQGHEVVGGDRWLTQVQERPVVGRGRYSGSGGRCMDASPIVPAVAAAWTPGPTARVAETSW